MILTWFPSDIIYVWRLKKRRERKQLDQQKVQYKCPKCENQHYVSDQIQTTGGTFSKLFDVQNKKFVAISCTQCGYTELFRRQNSMGIDILDFLMGS